MHRTRAKRSMGGEYSLTFTFEMGSLPTDQCESHASCRSCGGNWANKIKETFILAGCRGYYQPNLY